MNIVLYLEYTLVVYFQQSLPEVEADYEDELPDVPSGEPADRGTADDMFYEKKLFMHVIVHSS